MTHPDNTTGMLEAVRAKCVEVNPEIRCIMCGGQGYQAGHAPMEQHDPETGQCLNCPIQLQCEECRATGCRPIRLADVLLTLGIDGMDLGCALDDDGCVTCHPDVAKVLNLLTLWDFFRADSLDQQSPETIAFLHSLLCP